MKLGEPGLPDYEDCAPNVHWLPVEILLKQEMKTEGPILKDHLTMESEVQFILLYTKKFVLLKLFYTSKSILTRFFNGWQLLVALWL